MSTCRSAPPTQTTKSTTSSTTSRLKISRRPTRATVLLTLLGRCPPAPPSPRAQTRRPPLPLLLLAHHQPVTLNRRSTRSRLRAPNIALFLHRVWTVSMRVCLHPRRLPRRLRHCLNHHRPLPQDRPTAPCFQTRVSLPFQLPNPPFRSSAPPTPSDGPEPLAQFPWRPDSPPNLQVLSHPLLHRIHLSSTRPRLLPLALRNLSAQPCLLARSPQSWLTLLRKLPNSAQCLTAFPTQLRRRPPQARTLPLLHHWRPPAPPVLPHPLQVLVWPRPRPPLPLVHTVDPYLWAPAMK
jgi:hypothetical protein